MGKLIKNIIFSICLLAFCAIWTNTGLSATEGKKKPFIIINPNLTAQKQVNQEPAKPVEQKTGSIVSDNLDIVFVIDNSGSMKKNDPNFITKDVVKNFLKELSADVRLGMVVFDENAKLIQPLRPKNDSKGETRLLKGLEHVNYKGLFTNSPDGIERAIYELKTNGRNEAKKLIIFITDGIVDTGNEKMDARKTEWLKEELANEAQRVGIRIIGIAFTDNADFRLIQSLAFKTHGEYYRAFSVNDISTVFQNIKQLLSKPAPVENEEKAMAQADQPNAAKEPITKENAIIPTVENKQTEQSQAKIQPEGYRPPEKKATPTFTYILISIIIFLSTIILFKFFRERSNRASISGADTIDAEMGEMNAADPAMPQAELIDVENISTQQTSSLLLAKKKVTIGRDTNNDIVIPKSTISSFHATIEFNNGYFFVEDHRSTNGTRLNGKKVKQNTPVILKSGDKLDFANYEFRFLLFDQAPLGETVMFMKDDSMPIG